MARCPRRPLAPHRRDEDCSLHGSLPLLAAADPECLVRNKQQLASRRRVARQESPCVTACAHNVVVTDGPARHSRFRRPVVAAVTALSSRPSCSITPRVPSSCHSSWPRSLPTPVRALIPAAAPAPFSREPRRAQARCHAQPRRFQASAEIGQSHGAPGRIRTCDARFRKPMLYPLSYEG